MRAVSRFLVTAVVLLCGSIVAKAGDADGKGVASDPPNRPPAERLVREALDAELAADNAGRNSLLAEALKQNPNCRPARWQAGYIEIDKRWLTPEQAAAKAATDSSLAEYRRRRADAATAGLFSRGPVFAGIATTLKAPGQSPHTGNSDSLDVGKSSYRSEALSTAGVAAHAELARWCRKKNLPDEERAHWMQVLLNDPDNQEAQERLHLRSLLGRLMTDTQIEAAKHEHALEETQLKHWTPIVKRWQKALDRGGPPEQNRALSEMSSATDPALIPALERLEGLESPQGSAKSDSATSFERQAIALLGRLPQQRATYSLALQAVLARQAEVRRLATAELKKRPLHDFVPLLLDQLANPVEFNYVATYDAAGRFATYRGMARQEGPVSIRQIEESATVSGVSPLTVVISGLLRARTMHTPIGVSVVPNPSPDFGPIPAMLGKSANYAVTVDRQNSKIELMNGRINAVLVQVTSRAPSDSQAADDSDVIPDEATAKPVVSTAEYWWSWWADYNEAYRAYDKPLESVQWAVAKFSPDKTLFMSCFPAGTPVVTQLGPTPIEKIQIGDRVLAQNPDTGELSFKPVLGTTIRPPIAMLEVTTSAGAIRLTRGHPLWIVGQGWRMAKELQPSAHVHTLHGSETVLATHPADSAAAYNLIVADFGTYFVGPAAMLVHDNSPRLPSRSPVPGVSGSQ
jgi:hypothetical protein